ncbi:MAG: glutathione S-transferase family protein [Xanthomonadales bacterium]|nr:glutathione S-transferase family protein [Xanthomonadales bacterium]
MMELIGYMDSPYVRRVAISARLLDVPYQHRELSIWRDYDEFRAINPLVKVPTVVLDDGTMLAESSLIIDYLERQTATGRSLWPTDPQHYRPALHLTGIALVAMEKSVQLIYEKVQRPQEKQHPDWIARVQQQLGSALTLLESASEQADPWLVGRSVTQADISAAVAWRFTRHASVVDADPADHPALTAFSERAESLPEFQACPLSG